MLHASATSYVLKPGIAKITCEPNWKWLKREKPLENFDLFYVWSGEGQTVEIYNPAIVYHPDSPKYNLPEIVISHLFDGDIVALGLNQGRVVRLDSNTGEVVDCKNLFETTYQQMRLSPLSYQQ